MRDLMELVREIWPLEEAAEITIEANPGTLTMDRLLEYRESGINRISIGVQSMIETELEILGRIHDPEDARRAFEDAKKAGFDNINLDLISSVPGQSVEDARYSLEQVCEMHPTHISAYSLILEEDTYMYEHREEYDWIDEDTDRDIYHMTAAVLEEYGYDRYEISNYSLKGRECRHNIRYWTGGEYIGAGLGAASYMEDIRSRNTEVLSEYLAGVRHTEEIPIGARERMEEFMYLGLRMTSGVRRSVFKERFGRNLDDVFGDAVCGLCADALMSDDGEVIRLSGRGTDLSNYCFAKFLL